MILHPPQSDVILSLRRYKESAEAILEAKSHIARPCATDHWEELEDPDPQFPFVSFHSADDEEVLLPSLMG